MDCTISSILNNDPVDLLGGFIWSINDLNDSLELRRNFPAKNSMVVFVSSTFTDTHKERNNLLEKILPELQILCNPFNVRVVLVDMRYGVRDENTADHMTWIACEKELLRCYEESGSVAFLSLQGEKYGYRPIPKYIDKDIFETRLKDCSDLSVLSLVSKWYYLDKNSIPPVYVLRNLIGTNTKSFWDHALIPLRNLFRDMPFSEDNPILIIDRSVTEYETRKALSLSLSSDSKYSRMYWLHRQFTGGVTEAQDPRHHYNDVDGLVLKKKFDNLINTMTSELSLYNRIYSFHLPVESYINEDDIGKAHLKDWQEKSFTFLREQLEIVIQKKMSWEKDGYGTSKGCINGLIMQEFLHHVRWANLKCSTFLGRDSLLMDCVRKVYEPWDKTSNANENNTITTPTSKLQGIRLGIVGVSGSGKTALISKLAQSISGWDRANGVTRPVIIRFCGTTADSSNGLSLIHSISYQIRYLYNDTDATPMSSDYQTAVDYFQSLLANYPIVLLVDSLDQLSNANEARSKISFLVGVLPHVNTRIIVSCLPDERDAVTGSWKYCYLCDTRLKEAGVARVSVPQLGSGDGDNISDMIVKLLEASKRRVTEDQLSFALQQVTEEPTALYVSLATRIMSTWRSNDAVDTTLLLQPTVPNIINQIIDSLERDFGVVMTRCALGLMTFSVAGISDNEMQDLLSLDDVVMDSVFQYSKLETRRLPLHVWLRLRSALKGLVVERDSGCLVWYHRQLRETAEARYSYDERKHLHALLGTYFADTVDASVKTSRLIARHPLAWTDTFVWSPEAVINHRRCVEGGHHLCRAGLLAEAAEEICSFELICACAKIGVGFALLDNIIHLHSLLNDSVIVAKFAPNVISAVHHYYCWLRRDMNAIVNNPVANIPHTVTTSQPVTSIARLDFNRYLDTYKKSNNITNSATYWSKGWVVGKSLGGLSDFNSIQMSLTGHSGWVYSVSFSPDGQSIVSGSDDSTVKVWDVRTGNVLTTFEGHSGRVYSVNFSPDGQSIVSGSSDNTVKVWDVRTGNVLTTFEGHSGVVNSVNFSPDGQSIVSGSDDNTVKVWDVRTGNVLTTFEGHSDWVVSVNFSPDGQSIVSGSSDNTVKVWDVRTGNVLTTFEGHSETVRSVNFSPDGQSIVSGSSDNTVKVWDVRTGDVLTTLEGRSGAVFSVSFSPDGQCIVSGFSDNKIKLWDVRTGNMLITFKGHIGLVRSVNFSPDGQSIVSGSYDSTVKVWDIRTGNVVTTFEGHKDAVTSVNFSPDGQSIISGSSDNTVKVWDVRTGNVYTTLGGHSKIVRSVNFSPDGQSIVSGSSDKTVKIWDVRTGNVVISLEGHKDAVTSVNFSPDGQSIVSGSSDKTVKIWDVRTGNVLTTLEGHSDAEFLFSEEVRSVNFSPDGLSIVSGSDDSTVKVWDVRTGDGLTTFEGHSEAVRSVNFSPDGQSIVSGSSDTKVKVWDVRTRDVLTTFEGHSEAVTSVNFSPDGQYIVSGFSDSKVKVWDVRTGNVLITLEGHTGVVNSVNFSPDGQSIVSGSSDNTVKVWDVRTGNVLTTLEGEKITSGVCSGDL